jgi:hypothetical protein
MSTGVAVPENPEITAKGHGHEKPALRSNRYFFPAMASLILGGVVLGFAETYYLAGVFLAPLPNLLIHVHAAVFTAWILLLIVQSSLVLAKRVDLHRRLGIFGFGLAITMVVLGISAATDLLRRNQSAMGMDAKAFYAGALGDIVIFAILVFFAYRFRFNPPVHKRLILIATIALLGAPINRWPLEIIDRSPNIIFVFQYAFLLPIVVYDLWSVRRIERATIWGALCLIIIQQLALPFGRSAVWQSFATWALGLARAIHGA